jgi:hypothetical protein
MIDVKTQQNICSYKPLEIKLRKQLYLARILGDSLQLADYLEILGMIYQSRTGFLKAIRYYQFALIIYQKENQHYKAELLSEKIRSIEEQTQSEPSPQPLFSHLKRKIQQDRNNYELKWTNYHFLNNYDYEPIQLDRRRRESI